MVDTSAPSGSRFDKSAALRLGGYVPRLVSLGLVVLIGRMLATLAWSLASDPSSGWKPAPAVAAAAQPSSTIDIGRIAAAELFGRYVEPGTEVVASEPAVALGLDLVGSFYYRKDPRRSRVMIASSDGAEKPYAVGDPVGPNIKLVAIFSDHINIIRDGHLEMLRLDQLPGKGGPARNTVNVAANDATDNPGATQAKAATPPPAPVMHYGDD